MKTIEDQAGFGTIFSTPFDYYYINFTCGQSIDFIEDQAGFGKMEAGPLLKSTSITQFCTTKFSMASSLGTWRANTLLKSTSLAQFYETKLSMASSFKFGNPDGQSIVFIEDQLEKMEAVSKLKKY